MRRSVTGAVRIGSVLLLITIAAVLLSCNAESAAIQLFTKQGLNLLRPARDYIRPGGMVFVPKRGLPEYDDPKDDVPSEDGNLTDFQATILQETANKTTSLGAALSLATTVIPMPISAGVQSNRSVSLKQIDTSGLRLHTTALDTLIGMPNTSKAAADELRRGTRVFIVQEIYKAASLEVRAEDSKAFDVKLNDGTPVKECKAAQPTESDKDKSDAQLSKPTEPSKDPSKPATSTDKTKSTPTSVAKPKTLGDTASGTAPGDAKSKIGGSVEVCLADNFSLKMNTKQPIPFAVRLAEVELSGGTLQRRRGQIFQGTLGNEAISGSLVNENKPVLQQLKRRSH